VPAWIAHSEREPPVGLTYAWILKGCLDLLDGPAVSDRRVYPEADELVKTKFCPRDEFFIHRPETRRHKEERRLPNRRGIER